MAPPTAPAAPHRRILALALLPALLAWALFCGALAAGTAAYLHRASGAATEGTYARAEAVAAVAEHTLLRTFEAVQGMHDLLQLRQGLLEAEEAPGAHAIQAHIKSIVAGGRFGILQVGVTDRDGVGVWSTGEGAAGLSVADRDYVRVHLDGAAVDGPFVSHPLLGRSTGRWGVQVSRPVRDLWGRLVGVGWCPSTRSRCPSASGGTPAARPRSRWCAASGTGRCSPAAATSRPGWAGPAPRTTRPWRPRARPLRGGSPTAAPATGGRSSAPTGCPKACRWSSPPPSTWPPSGRSSAVPPRPRPRPPGRRCCSRCRPRCSGRAGGGSASGSRWRRRDPLTGLLNRRALEAQAWRLFAEAEASGQPLALLLLDLDHFKAVNDTHGHPAGDAVLRGVAEVLAREIRHDDLACRWGGEEMLAVLRNCDLARAEERAARLRAAIAAARFGGAPGLRVTASIGVAASPEHGAGLDELTGRADMALYVAKRYGRDRVVCAALAA